MNYQWLIPYVWAFMVGLSILGAYFIAAWVIHDYFPNLSRKLERWL